MSSSITSQVRPIPMISPLFDCFTRTEHESLDDSMSNSPTIPNGVPGASQSTERGGPHRLPNLNKESGWVFIDHHRDGKRWRVSMTSWCGRAYVRFQPWFHRDSDGWMPEKGQGFSVSVRDVQMFIDGLHALLSASADFDPVRDGGPCDPTH